MGYTPLDSEFVASTMLRYGPDVVAIWMLLLAATDKLGESSMQPSVAASLLRIADERATAAFEILSSPDIESKNKEHQGRRILPLENGHWRIVSHQKYQWLASRAAATQRQRDYLKRQKEREANGAKETMCEETGCGGPVAGMVGGRAVCSIHAFDAPEVE